MIRALVSISTLQLVVMLVLLGRSKLLALILGPSAVGVMAVVDRLLAVLAQSVSLSLPLAALRFLPETLDADPGAFHGVYARMRNVIVLSSMSALVLGVVVTLWWPAVWGEELKPHHQVVLLALLFVPVLALGPFIQSVLAARLQHNRAMLYSFVQQSVVASGLILGAWLCGLKGLYVCGAVGGLLVCGGMLSRLGGPSARRERSLRLPGKVWRFSLSLLALAFAAPFGALFVHYQVLAHLGAEASGWLQAAIGLSLAVRAGLGAAQGSFLIPNVSRGGEVAPRMAWAAHFQRTLAALIVAIVAPLVLFPRTAVSLLYSSEFLPGAALVGFFVLAEVVTLFQGCYQPMLLATDRLLFHVVENVVAQGLIVLLAGLLIPTLGLYGAPVAVASAPLFLITATLVYARLRLGVRPALSSLAAGAVTVGALLCCVWIGRMEVPELSLRGLVPRLGALAVCLALSPVLLPAAERGRLLARLPWRRARA